MRPLEDWDEDYVANEVKIADESATLEKKASGKFVLTTKGQPDAATKDVLAKQVSAFSNAGQGFIVYGIDDNKALDAGVPITIGKQPIKDWVEAVIPNLVYPPFTHCQAKVIQVVGHHAPDKAVLVVSVPLSERRPHWVTNPQEIAYIRAGAHSLPMSLQTLLDISSRGTASAAEIESLNPVGTPNNTGAVTAYQIQPLVRLINGPVCERWAFEMKVQVGGGRIVYTSSIGAEISNHSHLYILGTEPLFPARSTPVSSSPFRFEYDKTSDGGSLEILTVLYAGSAQPVRRVFGLKELEPSA